MADSDSIQRVEVWKPIPGHDDFEASEFGHIRRASDKRIWGQHVSKYGYYNVQLERRRLRASVLVCLAFHGPRPTDRHCTCHNNGDRLDNRAVNLRWGTQRENIIDKYLHGTMGIGEKNPFAKLTPDQVREIRRRGASGERQKDIAEDFGVCQVNVSAIIRRKTWSHVD